MTYVIILCSPLKPGDRQLCAIVTSGAEQLVQVLPSTNQKDAHVHHVGLGEPGLEQVAGGLEEVIGIVPIEKGLRVEAKERRCAADRIGIGQGAGGVGRPILAVGAATEHCPATRIVWPRVLAEVQRRAQDELLVASAQT